MSECNDYDVCSVNNKHSSVCLLLIVYTGTLYRVHKGSQIVYTQCVIKGMFKMFFNMKGTVRVISSNPPMKNDNARFTTVPLKSLSDKLFGSYFCFSRFKSV